ncbi:hypothetical protein [Brachybacterium epidermidis]
MRQLTVRANPALVRELKIRVLELDSSLQEYVIASLEMTLRSGVDPRSKS